MDQRLVTCQLFMIVQKNVIPFLAIEEGNKFMMRLGKEAPHVIEKPVDLGACAKENSAQDQPVTLSGWAMA